MKKTAVTAFLFLLVIILVTTRYIFFISYVKSCKSSFREQLIVSSASTLRQVSFSEQDLFKDKNGYQWKEENKELVILGAYHEVIAIKKIDDRYLVYVIEDKTENALFQNFFSMIQQKFPKHSDLVKLFFNLYFSKTSNDYLTRFYFTPFQRLVELSGLLHAGYNSAALKPPLA